jgi:acyl transferase domain-containing protein/acyl carrier protein
MENTADRAIAIVGAGCILPDSPNLAAFWDNIQKSRYSITEVSPERWNPDYYYDPDPRVPDKTYSKIGGWVREYEWDPLKWHLPIPPRVVNAMDEAQKWAIACTREALHDYGYPARAIDLDRVAVILGNAMAGEKHYLTALRVHFPEYAEELEHSASFAALPGAVREQITRELHDRIGRRFPEVTEDSMPGELANCIAGRIANLFNLHGPNYVVDAACASAMAAFTTAVDGLVEHEYDLAIAGGIDRNMGAPTFVKFCKIGALSATGSRPFAEGADGFVMGEGAAIFLLKRLADAERDQDKIYAVIRGMGGASDGKGKGITAPNPVGQKFSVERAWKNAGLAPGSGTLIEGHGTSTKVGDVVEVESMMSVLKQADLPAHSVALGSVKSNIGHLKGAAGAAGLLKASLALHHKMLPPSLNFKRPNPDIDFEHSPVYVNTELKPWPAPPDGVRRAGVSAFGFGGTNFHAVLEEYIPGRLNGNGKRSIAVSQLPPGNGHEGTIMNKDAAPAPASASCKAPFRGALVIGGNTDSEIVERLKTVQEAAKAGQAPPFTAPAESDLRAPERLAIDYADAAELADKSGKALAAFKANQAPLWKALRAQGIFHGHGAAGKVAFLYTGQGSQYVNMLRPFCEKEAIVADMFAEADRIMTPILGKPLSKFIYVDATDAAAVAKAEDDLRQTAITQPAVLAVDMAMTKLLEAYGVKPDMAMGHSLGEYGALIASGALPFDDALEAVAARGREMTRFSMKDNGKMAAVFAPLAEIERLLKTVNGYVVIANVNSEHQAVIGGASDAVVQAMEILLKAGYEVAEIPVSHAFHTSIVAPASEPLKQVLARLRLASPKLPIVANVDGEFYPTGPAVVPKMLDILGRQVAAPVQFVKGLRTLYNAGARIFVEVGPKKALHGFAEDVLGSDPAVLALFTNHPKFGDLVSFNQALCGLYSAGLGAGEARESLGGPLLRPILAQGGKSETRIPAALSSDRYSELGRWFAGVLEDGLKLYGKDGAPSEKPVAITGAAIGLPGTEHIFDDGNVGRILRGEALIDTIPPHLRQDMLTKHITRLVKSDNGGPTFETITNVADVIKLAGRGHTFDLEHEFGVPAERIAALDRVTQLAIAAGIDALRDAGIPLVMRYKTTTKGTKLPDRWMLPDALRDSTGVIFASAFPGYDAYADDITRCYEDQARRQRLADLQSIRENLVAVNGHSKLAEEIDRRVAALRDEIAQNPYDFDRRFLFRVLAMGHSQFAEFIGARGPNTQVNSACASTTLAVSLAEDWIRAGRARRVVVLSADDITTDRLIGWFGAGFLATGAAATDEVLEEAAIPFDRRRHGMLIGMGAAALVVESAEAAAERGLQPICEVLGTVAANSAFHGTRLDVQHIRQVMEDLVSRAEAHHGISRREIAPHTVFVSHETYTPARGGSAAAEIHALRSVFGDVADSVVIANTKGFTGHAMATGIEDVVAVKALETGVVPPVANFKEVDPELGMLNLSKGGAYPVEYALRLGAGFGSQISMTLLRWVASGDGIRRKPEELGYSYRIADQDAWKSWLANIAEVPSAELEVVNRTLRVRDAGMAARTALPVEKASVKSAPAVAAPKPTAEIKQMPPPKPAPVVAAPKPVVMAAAAAAVAAVPKPAPVAPVIAEVPKPVPVAAPAVAVAPAASPDEVKDRILKLVSEKTGYPIDMLDLDLDLEADLGVDTVKQAEVFAAVREMYGIPRDENLKLRDFPTLAHVIKFAQDRRPDMFAQKPAPALIQEEAKAAPAPKPVETPVAVATAKPATTEDVKDRILALVVEKTGYPREMLDLDLDLEADLGVDTVKQAEMFAAIREMYNIARDENRKLRDYPTLAHVIRFVYEKRPDLAGEAPSANKGAETAVATTPAATPPSAPVVQQVQLPVGNGCPTPAGVAGVGSQDVKDQILSLVVEKTGYPREMLDLDLDLEADLGVDTVKQAEMFAAIREIYNIPRDENRKLRDYPTLAHVVRFVYEKRPDLAGEAPSANQGAETAAVSTEVTPPPAPAAPEPSPAPAISADAIRDKVLEIVAEKTGYPKDMLDLDLDLEADLGIDTVKQAEMFAAVRGAYNIPRDENLKLRDFPTLAHVIKFAQDRAAAGAIPPIPAAKPAERTAAEMQAAKPRPPVASFEAADRIPRRVPVPTLRPPLDLCKPTGVTLAGGRRVILMPDKGGVAEALSARLEKLGVQVLRLEPTPNTEKLAEKLNSLLAAGAVHGVFWLPALDNEGPIAHMTLDTWHELLAVRLKGMHTVMRALYEQVAAAGTFLVSASRLGGQHGYDPAGAQSPMGGAVAGFTKTYKRERTDALVKAVDFETASAADHIAELLIAETLRDPGAVEIGYRNAQRFAVTLQEKPAADGQAGLTLDEKTVFLVTGAAGSIVSAITADLAAASGGTFYLLDLVPEPDPANPDLKRFATDKDGLKRELFARIQARGERATPAMIEKELAALERAEAAVSAIEAVRAAGGTAHYFSVDLTDAQAVAGVIRQVRERSGRIDVLLHAAGMERSHFLPDKDRREFDLVFDVKSDGWFNLLHAIGDMPLGATVAFSSIAGRFGNGGQTDYSSANDLLCKYTSSFRTTRPATRGIVIDWTAWGGIGMATRGSIPKMMEVAGIDMLPPEAGIPLIRRELTTGGTRGEIVVGQRLGILLNEFDETGGLDPSAANPAKPARGPMLGKITAAGLHSGLAIETTLDPKVQAFLYDHQIDGTPVLPGVMGVEAFAEAALALLPGWRIEAIEDVNFLAPFKFYRHEPRTVTINTVLRAESEAIVADCRLIGSRTLPNQAEPQVTTHFTGRVRLTPKLAEAAAGAAVTQPSAPAMEREGIYRIYFHGPAYQVIERAWREGNKVIGLTPAKLPANHSPAEQPLAISPRLIELCFQTAGLWEITAEGRMGLPQHIDRVAFFQAPDPAQGKTYALVTAEAGKFNAEVVDAAGHRYLSLAGYTTAALPNRVDAGPLHAVKAVAA